jgi:hypothetical protein
MDAVNRLFRALFQPVTGPLSRWVNRICLVLLFVLGILHWGYFLNWGSVPFDLHDWTETGPYYSFLRQALLTHQLPLHITSPLVTTDRYLARPDTLFSPQAFLLYFFEPGPFTLVNVLILYSIGFIGLLLLQKRYALSPAAFSGLFLLINFNGHITDHLAVGHSEWVGYFLLPFFALLVLQALDKTKIDWTWVLLMALVLFFLTLQGAFHMFLWCLIFLLALGLFYPRYVRLVFAAILSGVALSLLRLLPPTVEFLSGGPRFISGFPSITDLLAALVVLKYPAEVASGPFKSLGWWEVDTYIGFLGLVFIACFGVFTTWRKHSRELVLLAPVSLVEFLSIGRIYSFIAQLPLPLLDSERITSRFFILPLVVLAVVGSIRFQEFLITRGSLGIREGLLYLGLLVLMGHDLFQHSRIWRVTNMYALFKSTPVDIRATVSNHPDPLYYGAIILGLMGSLASLAFLVLKAYQERKRRVV